MSNCNRQLLIETFDYRVELLKNTEDTHPHNDGYSLDTSNKADLVSLQAWRLTVDKRGEEHDCPLALHKGDLHRCGDIDLMDLRHIFK